MEIARRQETRAEVLSGELRRTRNAFADERRGLKVGAAAMVRAQERHEDGGGGSATLCERGPDDAVGGATDGCADAGGDSQGVVRGAETRAGRRCSGRASRP